MSDTDDDDLVVYGTPLDPIDEDLRIAKAPRLEDQVVKDKGGRRRFHGAFTGGFSAGYFNSVSTKEGWTPSTFVSSRSQKNKEKSYQKPEDFMDDEDLDDHGIAPQKILATSDFDSNKSNERKRKNISDGPIPGQPVLEQVLCPVKETVGMKLLRNLGWKPGQGVGPRITKKQKKEAKNDLKRIYGLAGSSHKTDDDEYSSDDNEDLEYLKNTMLAPDDVIIEYINKPKSDQFGLGYKPLDRTQVLGGPINLFDTSSLSMTDKNKKLSIRGQAFGVGAFEEEDEDIYSREDLSQYDFSMTEEKESKKNLKNRMKANEMSFVGLTKALEGFKISSGQPYTLKVYSAPALPPQHVPQHKSRKHTRFEQKENETKGLGRHELSSSDRSRILSDKATTSFEIKSGLKKNQKEPFLCSDKEKPKEIDNLEIDQLYEEFKNTNTKLSSDFKPFGKYPEKQRRYDLYLKMKASGHKDRYYLAQPKSMTEWEKEREMREFDRAAYLFRPLASTMASRFVTAKIDDGAQKLKDGLNAYDPDMANNEVEDADIDVLGGSISDDRVKAANVKMFGKLTQYSIDWHPDKLLSRRFNVAPPYPDSDFVGTRKKGKSSVFTFLDGPVEDTAGLQNDKPNDSPSVSSVTPNNEVAVVEENSETYGLKVPIDGKPTMDLFKAIFCDSDSDDDDDEEENLTQNSRSINSPEVTASSVFDFISDIRKNTTKSDLISSPVQSNKSIIEKEKTIERKTVTNRCTSRWDREKALEQKNEEFKPTFMSRKNRENSTAASGLFAGLDFDAVNQTCSDVTNNEIQEVHTVTDNSSTDSEDLYGPTIPPHLANANRMQTIQEKPNIDPTSLLKNRKIPEKDTQWIVKDSPNSKKKKHKKKEKHKKKKEKKKKKKSKAKKSSKKHSRKKYSSSSNSSSSDSD